MQKFVCPDCHVRQTVKDYISFDDGTLADRMFCPKCGKQMKEVDIYEHNN